MGKCNQSSLGVCEVCGQPARVFVRAALPDGFVVDGKGQGWANFKPSPVIKRFCKAHSPAKEAVK